MFTLYGIVKRSVAETVPERVSIHTRSATFGTISAPEQDYYSPFLEEEYLQRNGTLVSVHTLKGAVIKLCQGGGWKGNSKFRQKFYSPCQISIFFHSQSEKLYLVSWPFCAAHAFLGTSTRKSMNCQVNAISKTTVLTHLY